MSPVFGVGSNSEKFASFWPAGEKEDAIPPVCRSNVGSLYARPVRVIPERGQVAENSAKSAAAEGGDVLQDDDLGS